MFLYLGAAAPDADSLYAAQREKFTAPLGWCEVLAELGRGGVGVVYRAKEFTLERLIALKTSFSVKRARPYNRYFP